MHLNLFICKSVDKRTRITNMSTLRIIFVLYLVNDLNGGVQQNAFINRLLLNTSNCPINACELIKLFSENMIKSAIDPNEQMQGTSK